MSRPARVAAFLAVAITVTAAPVGDGQGDVRLTPERIEMGSFYRGAHLRIEGFVAHGAEAIVVVRGPDREEVFNHKARFGFIWATAGRVQISGVPSLFFCYSPRPVDQMLGPNVIRERQLDRAAIKSQMRMEPEPAEGSADEIRSDFMALKQERGLYDVVVGGVETGEPCEEGTPFAVELEWPKVAPPESYTVRVLECRDGRVAEESSIPLEVVKVGFPESFAVLAAQHASLYGALAVLAAVVAGFGIDFLCARLFGARRGSAH